MGKPGGLSETFGAPLHIDAHMLAGEESIFGDAIRLVSGARKCIRVTALHEGIATGELGRKYINSIVERLKTGRDSNNPVELRIVSYEGIVENVLDRARIYHDRGVQDFVEVRVTRSCLDMGVLIVDDTGMHLSFPLTSADRSLRTTLAFNNAALIGRLVDWFDNHLWNTACQIPDPRP